MSLGVDPWFKIARNGGYSPAFLARLKASRRGRNKREADRLEPFVLDETRRFRERGVPVWAVEIARAVCAAHGVSIAAIAGKVRNEHTNRARYAAIYAMKEARPATSSLTLAKWFDRHHTSILFALAVHQNEAGARPLTTYSGKGAHRREAA